MMIYMKYNFETHPNKISKTSDRLEFKFTNDMEIDIKFQSLPNDVGIFPSSLLFERSRVLIEVVRFPKALEIEPFKLLSE